jgi:hypothetical protein
MFFGKIKHVKQSKILPDNASKQNRMVLFIARFNQSNYELFQSFVLFLSSLFFLELGRCKLKKMRKERGRKEYELWREPWFYECRSSLGEIW